MRQSKLVIRKFSSLIDFPVCVAIIFFIFHIKQVNFADAFLELICLYEMDKTFLGVNQTEIHYTATA